MTLKVNFFAYLFCLKQDGDVTRNSDVLCATTLCHFGRARNGYVATLFVLVGSTAESSAKGGYVVVPELIGQSEGRAGRNVEPTKEKPSFVPRSDFFQCKYLNTCKH